MVVFVRGNGVGRVGWHVDCFNVFQVQSDTMNNQICVEGFAKAGPVQHHNGLNE